MLKRTIFGVMVACAMAAYFVTPHSASAQTDASSRGITVVPPSFELYSNPGESITEKVRVRNEAGAPSDYQIMVEDFKAVGEEGAVDLVDTEQSDTTFSLASWVSPTPKSFTLQPGEEKEVYFTINVPKDAEPGGHYCSILVKIGGDTAVESGAAVATRVGSLVLLRVSGNVKEEAAVESFSTNKKYYESSPVTFDLRVSNAGSNHIKPKGTIVITNLFGQKITEVALNGLNVLPSAIRKMDTEWKFTSTLANRFTGTLVATYGQQNKPLSATTSFIVFPKYLAIIVGVIIILILAAIIGRKKIKRILHNLTK